jgi:PAS domain S-box-containing protein
VGDAADILDLVQESVVTRDAEGRVLSWNKASETLYGVPRADALGRDVHVLLATRHETPLAELEAALLAKDHWAGELIRTTASGEALILDVRWTTERDGAGNLVRIIETARDITRRKAAEDALRLSEYRYRNMFQAMAVAFWEVDFTAVGAMLIPLRDQGVTDLRAHLMANRDLVRETMRRAIVLDLNANGSTLFGATDPAQIVGRAVADFWPVESEPVYVDALVATMTRQPHIVTETRLFRVDGAPVDVLFTVSLSQENRRRGVMLIGVVDISARKAAEAALATVQAEFAHAARVSMLGELTASIAHEVNQPLAAIATSASASLRWLAASEPDLDEVRALAERIVGDARRAGAIIARVRAMAERREPERVALSLNELVEEVLVFLAHELRAQQVEIALRLDPGLPPVLADRTQLQQILVNLAVNAMQAMADASPRRLSFSTATDEGRVVLAIEDSGPGLGADAARLFDSFYTTKRGGMGMGLPICRGIAEAHGGTIAAGNCEGGGARFAVTLPAIAVIPTS